MNASGTYDTAVHEACVHIVCSSMFLLAVPAVMAVVAAHLRASSSCDALPLRTGASHGTTRSPAPAISHVCPSPGRAEMAGGPVREKDSRLTKPDDSTVNCTTLGGGFFFRSFDPSGLMARAGQRIARAPAPAARDRDKINSPSKCVATTSSSDDAERRHLRLHCTQITVHSRAASIRRWTCRH
jgi:hypothetical protein